MTSLHLWSTTIWHDQRQNRQRKDSRAHIGTDASPGNGRSGFIVEAIEEKIARRKPVRWKPKTARGHRMAVLLEAGRSERMPLLSDERMEQELSERRGRKC